MAEAPMPKYKHLVNLKFYSSNGQTSIFLVCEAQVSAVVGQNFQGIIKSLYICQGQVVVLLLASPSRIAPAGM